MEFKGIKSKKVAANFKGGRITSDGGALLLRKAESKIQFLSQLSKAIKDQRHQGYIEHRYETMIQQRVFGIACGYEDGNDHGELRKDEMFKLITNKDVNDKDLASPSTLCRLENSISREDMVNIAKVFVEIFIRSFSKEPKEIILDFDATDDQLHGRQEQGYFNSYYGGYCYLPLYIFCGEKLVLPYLRPSNIDGARHSWALLSLLVKRFRQEWPKVKIIFRADAGFCRHRMLDWCDRHNVGYIIGIGRNSRLAEAAQSIIEESRKAFDGENPVKIFGEVSYGAKTWNRERRVIVKVEQRVEGENIRYLVTNIEDIPEERLYQQLYCLRGDMENRIKEQQLYLFADRTSCSKFLSNQFRLFLASAAYVLLEYIRRVGLKGTELAKAQCSTIRLKLLKIGGIIISNTRRITIQLSECFVYKKLFAQAILRL